MLTKIATKFVQSNYNTADFAHLKLKYLKIFFYIPAKRTAVCAKPR